MKDYDNETKSQINRLRESKSRLDVLSARLEHLEAKLHTDSNPMKNNFDEFIDEINEKIFILEELI